MSNLYVQYPTTGVPIYTDFASFPATAVTGALGVDAAIGNLYEWSGSAWQLIAGPGGMSSIGPFGSTPNSAGGSVSAGVLTLQPADGSNPGGVSILAQTFAGVKTFSSAPNLSSLTASTALVLDGSKNIASLAYTSANTASTLVARDASGNFSAGTITASLTGAASLNVLTASLGNLTDAGTDGIVVTGGTGAVVGTVSLAQHVADTTHNGYLSSTDWNTFNGKQSSGNYITALTGDITASGPGSVAATVAKIQGTAVSGTTGSVNVVFSTSPTLVSPALGTPTALVGTNITGTASGLTAGTCTTIPSLSGEVSSSGNSLTLVNASVIGKVLTGYTSGAGTVAATDTILQAIQKLNGNDSTNANLTGPITSVGNATSIAAQTGTGTTFVVQTSPVLTTPNIGTPTAGVLSSCTGLSLTTGVTGVLPIANGGTNVNAVTTAPTATAFAGWDANSNLSANNHLGGFTTTATAAATTTMTIASTATQVWTGTTTQTIKLPTTSIVAGAQYTIINQSTGAVTVQSSGANTIVILNANGRATFTALVATPTTTANWDITSIRQIPVITTFAGGASGTFTAPAGASSIEVEIAGGGGGGGAESAGNGSNGSGATTFGTLSVAAGVGGGGAGSSAGGAGGAKPTIPAGYTGYSFAGGNGGSASNAVLIAGGVGGSNAFGGGGGGGPGGIPGGAGVAGSSPGAGGGGSGGSTTVASAAGGGSGAYLKLSYNPSASETFVYSVATGGGGGSSVSTGGNGADGIIKVTVFW